MFTKSFLGSRDGWTKEHKWRGLVLRIPKHENSTEH